MRISSTVILALPMLIGGFVQFIISQYYQKFATDALLLDSAIIGGIFFVSRFSDAVLDPVCGILSDKLGNRRMFIGLGVASLVAGAVLAFLPAAAVPVAGHFLGNQVQAANLTNYILAAAGIFTIYLGVTLVYIPHYTWLAELNNRHAGLPFFASRAITENLGTILGGLALGLLVPYQVTGGAHLLWLVVFMVTVLALVAVIPLFAYPDTGLSAARASHSLAESLKALGKNRRFAIVAAMSFCNQFAATTLLAVSLYYTDYVLGNKDLGVNLAIVFLLSATAFVPVWSALSRKFNRYHLWMAALVIIIATFPTLIIAQAGIPWYMLVFAVIVGGAAGAVILFVPQEVSDLTGAEPGDTGLYFAAFTFVNKSAMAAVPLVIGFALKIAGYNPQAITTAAKDTIIFLFMGMPVIAFVASAILLHLYRQKAPTSQPV